MKKLLHFTLTIALCQIGYAQDIYYVDQNATGFPEDGSSWATAYTDLQSALSSANSGAEVWVAAGTYTPGTLEADSFTIPDNVTVLGGFNGTETTADERNWAANPTILSGDLNNSLTENPGDSHTIVTMLGNNIEINGFYIQWGYADDGTDNSHPAIGRSGAGIYNNGNNRIYNCNIRSNVADTTDDPEIGIGAGLVSFGGTLDIINCLFNSNRASANGGAIFAEAGTINIINCTITNNNANKGGGVHFFNGNVHATNTIFTNNNGSNGNINDDGGAGAGTANYCLFYNTTTGNNSELPPNITGSNNIENTDPSLTNGYELAYSSPATDAGDNTANSLAKDLNANNRISNTTIDIGAYEYQNLCEDLAIGTTVYVNQNATAEPKDGSSWANAFTSLESALALQDCGFTGEIRVAGGQTFYPNSATGITNPNPTEFYFWMNKNIKLKGSYNPSTDTQDFTNPSILSGDLGTTNTVHVLVTTNLNNTALIEGFTITGGAAVHATGSVTIGGQVIHYNRGGGVYNANSSPSISNVSIVNNSASYGGGMYNYNSSPSITNATFVNNSASYGGGMYNVSSSSPSLSNVTFFGNIANVKGGGMRNNTSAPSLNNTLFYGNSSPDEPDIANYSSSTSGSYNASDVASSVLSGQTGFVALNNNPFAYSIYPAGVDGIFGTADDGLHLLATSPATDAGNNANLPVDVNDLDGDGNTTETIPYDITGADRIQNTTVNIGAYESIISCPYPTATTLFVNASVSGGANDGSSWTNAYSSLLDAIIQANICTNITEIWVAKGTYKPLNETTPFFIPDDVSLYGGFAGTETALTDRNWAVNPTILSGDFNGNNIPDTGDSHTIIRMPYNNSTLDGFTVTYSYADGTENSPLAIGRAGGGVYNKGDNNTIKHCIFKNNIAYGDGTIGIGGAVVSFSTDILTIYNSLFYNNEASANGGALALENGTTKLINCTVANNTANKGGGVHFYGGSLEAVNTIFTNNSGTNGNINDDGGSGTGTANHCLFYNTTTGNDGNVPPNITGSNNIAATAGSGDAGINPLFTDATNNDYSLQNSSPAVNVGNNTVNSETKDLANNNRIKGTAIDIGAYELQSTLTISDVSTTDFKIYPNPVSNILNIKTESQQFDYSIYNIQGQEVLKSSSVKTSIIDVTSLPTGIYILKLASNNKMESFKIIKQ